MHELIVEIKARKTTRASHAGGVAFGIGHPRSGHVGGRKHTGAADPITPVSPAPEPKVEPWSVKIGTNGPGGPRHQRTWDAELEIEAALVAYPGRIDDGVRLHFAGDSKVLSRFVQQVRKKLVVRVVRLGPYRQNLPYALAALTDVQLRALTAAHQLGYYEIPRKASTEDVAKALKMHKGTAGEHLRRAERHVFAELLR